MRNRQWLLKTRPHGLPSPGDFELVESELSSRDLKDDELLVRNRLFLCAPTMRNWMSGQANSLFPVQPLGRPMMAPAAGEVVHSKNAAYKPGDRLTYFGSWSDYEIIAPAGGNVARVPDDMSLTEAMGPLGLNPQTAYFGVTRVAPPKPGDVALVSGAAGSTGSTAAQIYRLLGARVIGVAGGPEKCEWLLKTCRLDAAIDYKNENVRDRLKSLCPDGVNIFFDNVGGDILQAAVDHMARRGRIVVCGQIASYNDDATAEGPRNMMRVVYGSIRIEGFLRSDYLEHVGEAVGRLREWMARGELVHRTDLRRGFSAAPAVFADLFNGRNAGTLLIEVDIKS